MVLSRSLPSRTSWRSAATKPVSLAGGKIRSGVCANAATGVATITLEEKEFRVGLKFTPIVLEGGEST
ncbi:MAG: hypothetical protein IPM01_31105 [Burkholderiaceae bacterium]|nr:hypothetical protein [Burkholderiaceae bacterium]